MGKYDTIMFGCEDVLLHGIELATKPVASYLGVTTKEFLERKAATDEFLLEAMRGNMTELEYYEKLLSGTGWKITPEWFGDLIKPEFTRRVFGTYDTAKNLKPHYRIVVISDSIGEWTSCIKANTRDLNIFDKAYFSSKMNLLKRDPETFPRILQDLGIAPSQAIYIGHAQVDLDSAAACGINTLYFTSGTVIQRDLWNNFSIRA